jgi:hypothetical protein
MRNTMIYLVTLVTIPDINFWKHPVEGVCGQLYSRSTWVNESGIKYQNSACVVLGRSNDDQPIFGEIKHCYIVKHHVLLHVDQLNTSGFVDHFHSFLITNNNNLQLLVWTSDLCDHHVYGLYRQPILLTNSYVNHNKFIVPKFSFYFLK